MVKLQKNEQELVNSVMGKINLSKDKKNLESHVVNLSKCVVNLSKENNVDIGNIRAKVIVVLDYSGSMKRLYKNGDMQKAINKLIPLGLTFDDNGSLDVYLFNRSHKKIDDMNINNYANYIEEVVIPSWSKMGGTKYSPVLNEILGIDNTYTKKDKTNIFSKLFNKKHNKQVVDKDNIKFKEDPTFILFITDGDNEEEDKIETEEIIKFISKENMFIQFIGIGHDRFDFLEDLDDLSDRAVDNTGFSKVTDIVNADDTYLYNNILGQFSKWLSLTHG